MNNIIDVLKREIDKLNQEALSYQYFVTEVKEDNENYFFILNVYIGDEIQNTYGGIWFLIINKNDFTVERSGCMKDYFYIVKLKDSELEVPSYLVKKNQ